MEKKGTWPWRKKPEKNTSQLLTPATYSSSLQLDGPSCTAHDPIAPNNHHIEPQPFLQQQIRQHSSFGEDAGGNDGAAGTEETVKMLRLRILDLSSKLVEKEELASQQARVSNNAIKDLVDKDEQLKQHVVALKEEKSAREKAETVCLSLKQELDKVCQQKSSVETRVMQLNGALQECMDEVCQSKAQLEHKAQEMTSRKSEWDKLRKELETENANLKRQVMEAAAENIAVSKSLQERGRSLHEISETRARVESESKILQVQIESLHKDMDAYKYEVHVLKKELQIRNEEIEQSRKAADANYKQHLESVKKIAKLDSECNRLRVLVRKKLPGPAAIAQMRVEADHAGTKRIPSPLKMSPDHRELEALSDRMSALEDETKLLKEALSKRTAELQAARQLCARTVSKLSSAESIIEAMARGQALPASWNEENHATLRSGKCDTAQQQGFAPSPALQGAGNETMEVMDWAVSSEDGNNNDDELSSAESWASALIAELSHLKKDDGSLTAKNEETGKPGSLPLVSHVELQSALQELNIKLSSIGESILALPSSMKYVGEQGSAIKSKPMPFEMVGQIMDEFTIVKQLLVEVLKFLELERHQAQVVGELEGSVQGSDANKTERSIVIGECDEDWTPLVETNSGGDTYMGVLRQVMQAFVVPLGNKRGELIGSEDVFARFQKTVDALTDGQIRLAMSEEVAAELLCKIGDLLKEQCIASCGLPASVAVGQNSVDEARAGSIAMCVGGEVLASGDGEISNTREDQEHISGIDKDGGISAVVRDSDTMDCSINSGDAKVCSRIDTTGNKRDAVKDSANVAETTNGKIPSVNSELILQLELFQHEVEKLTEERDQLAAKLVATQGQLEEELARIATLDAESVLLASEKASLAQQLSDRAARNQSLEEDLADARASLDDLRQQVSSLTSELADQTSRCQELQGTLSDVGTPDKGRSQFDTNADGKHRKEREIASAKAQLAECQRTILVLGSQLRALSSVQDGEPSFDSSLESATSTDHVSLPPMTEADGDVLYEMRHVAGRQRRAQPGYVRTRGGRLVSADQYWGSAGDIPVAGSQVGTPSHPALVAHSYSNRHVTLPARHSYGAAYSQSPLHDYVTEDSAYVYSPPETALSSPAASPAPYDLQLGRVLKAQPLGSSPAAAATLLKSINKAVAAGGAAGCPSPSPARRSSRIARFFARAKNQR